MNYCGGAFHGASLEQPTVFHERDRDIEILYREKIGILTMKRNYTKNFCLQAATQNLLALFIKMQNKQKCFSVAQLCGQLISQFLLHNKWEWFAWLLLVSREENLMNVFERTFPCNCAVNITKCSFGRLMKLIPWELKRKLIATSYGSFYIADYILHSCSNVTIFGYAWYFAIKFSISVMLAVLMLTFWLGPYFAFI